MDRISVILGVTTWLMGPAGAADFPAPPPPSATVDLRLPARYCRIGSCPEAARRAFVVVPGGNSTPGRWRHRITAQYPPLARAAGIEGDVVILVQLAGDGTVQEATVASGHSLLVTAAWEAVLNSPGVSQPAGEEEIVMVTVPFRLGDRRAKVPPAATQPPR